MTEETDAPQGGTEAEAVAETSQVEAPTQGNADDTAAQETGTEQPGQADETGEPAKRKPWWEKRFDELTAKRYDAERDAAYWRGIAEGRTPQPSTPQHPIGPPQLEQFDDYDAYEEAKIAYVVEQRLADARQQEQRQTVLRTHEEREAAFRATKPDYDTIVRDPSLPITAVMAEVIRESDVGPQVVYHLATNRQEAQRIAGLPPHRQAAELGRIEALLTKAPSSLQPKPIPHAPPPTVGGVSAGLSKTMGEMSFAEFKAMREEEEKNRN